MPHSVQSMNTHKLAHTHTVSTRGDSEREARARDFTRFLMSERAAGAQYLKKEKL